MALRKELRSHDVKGSPTVEFVTTAAEPPPPPEAAAGIAWPTFGYNAARTRAAPFSHQPPLRRVWTFRGRQLLEFPPAVAHGRLYVANNSGVLFAVNAATGRLAWKHDSGRCVAASPAVTGDTVYLAFLNRPPCNASGSGLDGEVVAFAAGFGTVRWRVRIGPTESSPLVADGLVYVGDWRGKVYALDARTGEERWSFQSGGKVKGALALAGGRVFFGSYDHHVYALDARTGELVWRASAQDRIGGRGNFYSTPAVAYGRVYIGSTDGKVYSFGAASGKLRWSQSTGGYVYASPAVWEQKVFAGSYSGRFSALDAATGEEVWSFRANGRILGSATVLDGVVWFSILRERTYALDARTGALLWEFPDGKYTPVVADAERLYLVGHARVYGMVER